MLDSKHLLESGFVPGVLNNFRGLSCSENDGSCYRLIRVYLREHELLLDRLQGKVVNVTAHLLQGLPVVISAAAGSHQAVVCEENALIEVILDEVEWSDRIQVPGEHAKQVELAALDGVEAWVRAVLG